MLLLIFSPLISTLRIKTYIGVSYFEEINKKNSFFRLNSSNSILSSTSFLNNELNGCTFPQNVTYTLDYNFTIKLSYENVNMILWFGRIDSYSNSRFVGTAPLQTAQMLLNSTSNNPYSYIYDDQDDYNNSYDIYSMNLDVNNYYMFSYVTKYNITLREIIWDVDPSNIGVYNLSDPLYINNTKAEENLEADNPDLQSLSNEICKDSSNILEKAQSIYNYIINEMEYIVDNVDKGAYEAWNLGLKGDCSEYSDLMVTLLRIQGIPARKVLGLGLIDGTDVSNPKILDPIIDNEVSYDYDSLDKDNTNIPLHAWVEYFIPNYGWISCDPTWGQGGGNYFNRIDSAHIVTSIGENYGGGIDQSFGSIIDNIPEFSILPYGIYSPIPLDPNNIKYTLNIKVKITEVKSSYPSILEIIAIIFLICSISCIIFVIFKKLRLKEIKEI